MYKYKDIIHQDQINKGLKNGYVVNGHCVLLNIGPDTYEKFKIFMNKKKYIKSNKCISMYDEVSIVKFTMDIGETWKQLGSLYNTIPWKNTYENSYILHYFNKTKPWQMNRGEWADLKIWYEYWDGFNKEYF